MEVDDAEARAGADGEGEAVGGGDVMRLGRGGRSGGGRRIPGRRGRGQELGGIWNANHEEQWSEMISTSLATWKRSVTY